MILELRWRLAALAAGSRTPITATTHASPAAALRCIHLILQEG